jgi:hypothetical protein
VLQSFRIQSNAVYFRNLGWIGDSRGHSDHHTCASTRRCCSCGAGVVAPRSSWPWGRLRRLHHQRLCGSIIPVFGLQGYVVEHPFTVTKLLIDRSLGNSGLRINKNIVICIKPQHFLYQFLFWKLFLLANKWSSTQ